jgi:hypothetical protein
VQKEELLHLHMLMVHLRHFYEEMNSEEILTSRYDCLDISPVHIHKNKKCHKDALLTLGDELVGYIRGSQPVMIEYAGEPAPKEIAVEH